MRKLYFLFLLAFWAAAAHAQVDQAAITATAQQELTATHTPGAAIGIVIDNQLAYAFGVGVSDVETGAPVHAQMLFRLGSTTKMMNAGDPGAKLSKAAVTALTSPHADIPGSTAKYGYGLQVEMHGTEPYWNHGGSRAGYGSFIAMLPARHAAVIVLANRSGESLPRTRRRIMESLGFTEPVPIESPATSPIPASDFKKYVGDYRNGDAVTHVTVKDGKLWVGKLEARIDKDGWLVVPNAGRAFPVAGPDGRTAYLFQGGRCRARVK